MTTIELEVLKKRASQMTTKELDDWKFQIAMSDRWDNDDYEITHIIREEKKKRALN